MKKFVFALYSDTVFVGLATFIFSFALFRFYFKTFAIALIFSIFTALSVGVLAFFLFKRKTDKKFLKLCDEKDMEKLKFHLALDSKENNFQRFFNALSKKYQSAQKQDDCIFANQKNYYISFKLEPVSADQIVDLIKLSNGKDTVLLTCSATPDALNISKNFNIQIADAKEIYLLLKETDCLPEKYIYSEKMIGFKEKLKFRFSKRAYKGYLLSGAILLFFSLFTFFPVYYLISGGILLLIAVAVKLFGKETV